VSGHNQQGRAEALKCRASSWVSRIDQMSLGPNTIDCAWTPPCMSRHHQRAGQTGVIAIPTSFPRLCSLSADPAGRARQAHTSGGASSRSRLRKAATHWAADACGQSAAIWVSPCFWDGSGPLPLAKDLRFTPRDSDMQAQPLWCRAGCRGRSGLGAPVSMETFDHPARGHVERRNRRPGCGAACEGDALWRC